MNSRFAIIFFSLMLLLLSCFTFDSFLFEPTKVTEYFQPADLDTSWHIRNIIPDTLIQPVQLTSMENKIYGFFVYPDGLSEHSLENQVTIIYCHGSGENINRYWGRVELLWEIGYKIFIFDYQGYGKSEGSPSAVGCYSDGEAALDYCRSRNDVDENKIVYFGSSLGSFIATYLACDVKYPLGLILEVPLSSVSAITREGTVLNIPGSYVVEADFDNEKRITKVESPILIIYGKNDDTAVPERHAEVLIDLLEKANKDFESYEADANHDDIPEKMGDEYGRIINDFIIKIFNE